MKENNNLFAIVSVLLVAFIMIISVLSLNSLYNKEQGSGDIKTELCDLAKKSTLKNYKAKVYDNCIIGEKEGKHYVNGTFSVGDKLFLYECSKKIDAIGEHLSCDNQIVK